MCNHRLPTDTCAITKYLCSEQHVGAAVVLKRHLLCSSSNRSVLSHEQQAASPDFCHLCKLKYSFQTIKTPHPRMYPHLLQESCQWEPVAQQCVAVVGVESARKKEKERGFTEGLSLRTYIPSFSSLHTRPFFFIFACATFEVFFVSVPFHVPERVAARTACICPTAAFPRCPPSFRREASPCIVFVPGNSAEYLRR